MRGRHSYRASDYLPDTLLPLLGSEDLPRIGNYKVAQSLLRTGYDKADPLCFHVAQPDGEVFTVGASVFEHTNGIDKFSGMLHCHVMSRCNSLRD